MLSAFRRDLKQTLVISRTAPGPVDPVTGAATLQISEIYRGRCSLQSIQVTKGVAIVLNAGVPLDLPLFRAFARWKLLPPGPYLIQIDGLTYPLKRPVADLGGQGEVMQLDLGPAE